MTQQGFGKLWLAAGVVALLVVSGCGRAGLRSADPIFDGHRFAASVRAESRRDREVFTVTVRGVSKSLDGAREAAAYHAARHCLRYFGTSEVIWQSDPAADPETLTIENDALTVAGSCFDVAG
jgi:hypothetical protein